MGREFPGGVKIKDAEKHWNDDQMSFSFRAQKGFLGATIDGTISVTDAEASLSSNIPRLVTSFVSEEKIRTVITDQFNTLFGVGPDDATKPQQVAEPTVSPTGTTERRECDR